MNPEIRLAGPGDVSRMARIERLCFPSPWSESQLLRCVRVSGRSRTWLAVRGGEILGYVCVVTTDFGLLHVGNLAVHPGSRGEGTGTLLMRIAEEWGARIGACASFLEVRRENEPAQALYGKLGYRVQTELRDYYGKGEDGLRCVKELPVHPSSGLVAALRSALGDVPGTGMILGSGLSWVTELWESGESVDLGDIPGQDEDRVPGHPGRISTSGCGRFLFLQGRRHRFQGFDGDAITELPGALSDLGTHTWVLTTSSGAMAPGFEVGDAMVFSDHVNLSGCVPSDRYGVTGDGVYSRELRDLALQVARSTGSPVRAGIFACVTGPAYETPAEVGFLRSREVSAVSMSTVQEALLLSGRGCRVLGLSLITNTADSEKTVTHEEVLSAQDVVRRKQEGFIRRLLEKAAVNGLR